MVCLAYHFQRLLSKVKVDATIFNVAQIERLQVTAAQVCQATCKDAVLSKVLQYTQHGWPTDVASDLVPFKNRAQELCVLRTTAYYGEQESLSLLNFNSVS